MNNRFLTTIPLIASSALFVTGCGDNTAFETPNTSNTVTNNNLISQNNFTLLFNPVNASFLDPTTGEFTSVTGEISVQIGDNNNQLITGSRVINFRTEWGLIEPSCTTENGTCSVTWRSGSPDTMPSNLRNTIIAYSNGGQESFADLNGNGLFDDGDTFNTNTYSDLEEPYVNVDESNNGFSITFTAGDIVIDTINGIDLTGANASHDNADGLFNGPNCAHSTLCSTTRTSVTVWESGTLLLNGGTTFDVGGLITGLAGTLIIQNNLSGSQTLTADGTYTYSIIGGTSYSITVLSQPAGQTCTITKASDTPTSDVTDANITCN